MKKKNLTKKFLPLFIPKLEQRTQYLTPRLPAVRRLTDGQFVNCYPCRSRSRTTSAEIVVNNCTELPVYCLANMLNPKHCHEFQRLLLVQKKTGETWGAIWTKAQKWSTPQIARTHARNGQSTKQSSGALHKISPASACKSNPKLKFDAKIASSSHDKTNPALHLHTCVRQITLGDQHVRRGGAAASRRRWWRCYRRREEAQELEPEEGLRQKPPL